MKYCPQCNLEYEDETVFCSADGSRLQMRVPRAGARPQGGLGGGGMSGGLGAAVLSSQPISALGSTALQVPTPARGLPATKLAPIDDAAATMRPPTTAPSGGGLAVDLMRDTISPPQPRQPAISAEMRMPGASDSDGAGSDLLTDMPTIAMKSPISAPQPTHDEDGHRNLVNTVVAGRYKVLRRLGEGGMGVVYEAIDERLEKRVAVKVLRDDFARRQDVVARFTQEAKSAARIKHENVLDVTDYGQTDDGSFFIAMELLTGTDLADVLQADGVVAQDRGVEVAIQVCRALQAAHQKGIVHRDMKPENVFLVRTDDGRELVKIVDFGIAQMKDISGSSEGSRKLTRTGMIFGTPEYMSPEQAAGKPVDQRVDVYASGIILYEMFAGRVPFMGDTFMGILTKHMFEQPPTLKQVNPAVSVPVELEAIIFKALAKDPSERYQSMQEFGDDLQRFRAGQRTSASYASPSMPVIPPMAAQVLGVSSQGAPMYGQPLLQGVEPNAIPSRTVEGELTTSRKRPVLIAVVVAVFLLLGVGVVAAVALSNSSSGPETPQRPQTQAPQTQAPQTQAPHAQAPQTPQARPQTPTSPEAHAQQAGVNVAPPAPPTPRSVRVRVVADGFPSRSMVAFQYVDAAPTRPAVAPCEDASDCRREVQSGAAIRVIVQSRRGSGTVTATPTRDDEEIRVSFSRNAQHPDQNAASQRPSSTQHPTAHGEVPCGELDPHTGLIRICFDR